MRIKLDTIVLFGVDLPALRNFYAVVLGMPIIEDEPNWILMDAGGARIGLHKIDPQYLDDTDAPFSVDNNVKIVLSIDEDIQALRSELIAKDVMMKEVMTWEGYDYWLCGGRDPEGNVFQLKQRKDEVWVCGYGR